MSSLLGHCVFHHKKFNPTKVFFQICENDKMNSISLMKPSFVEHPKHQIISMYLLAKVSYHITLE